MKLLLRSAIALSLVLALGACGDAKAENCWQYEAQIDDLIAAGDNEALLSFIEDSEEHVAQLVFDDPDRAGPCVESVLEAIFVAEFADFEFDIDFEE